MSAFIEPSWKLVPGKTVLINIDDQNDFLHPEGAYQQHGVDISHMQRVIGPTNRLVQACRDRDVPIIWTTHGTRSAVDGGPFYHLRPLLSSGGLRVGTWGYQLTDEMDVQEEDWIVAKHRLSSFYETNLDSILRGLGIDTVLITGVLTNQCVGATTKDALFRDYKPIVVEECTGTAFPELHDPAIAMIRAGWGQVNTVDETITELNQFSAAVA